MFRFDSVVVTKNGDAQKANTVKKKLAKGVTAVFVDGKSDVALDSENGAYVSIEMGAIDSRTAVFRHTEFWCMPDFSDTLDNVPDETQMLLVKQNEMYTCILPVVDKDYRCVLVGKDGLKAKLFTWCDGICECRSLAFVYKSGKDPYVAVHDCFEQALSEIGNGVLMREERKYPEMFEYLGWCSWDALQIRVCEDKLIEKCEEFKNKDIPVRWGIIDDMWADVPKFTKETYATRQEMFQLMHSSALASFEGAPERFPDGLAHAIKRMKQYFTWVGMWHPTTGYWFGIEPGSELFAQFKDNLYKTADGRYIPNCTYKDFSAFFDTFHKFLHDCGADFVKVDNQSMTRHFYKGCDTVGKIARSEHDAIEDSTVKYFDNALINCMGCASDNIWNRKTSPVSRCSDDFQPENRDWFTKHILQCSYVSLFQGQVINCDWDMWWTDDGQAVKNSVIRAISGGPIYVSDEIGRSRREILMPLVLSDGKILRCDAPATPTKDCLFGNPEHNGRIFKLQNKCGNSGTIAAFDLDADEKTATGTISPDDVEELEGEEFAVYEHFAKKYYVMRRGEKMDVEFAGRDDFRLYTFTPIVDGFAVIGLVDKFMSPLTVKNVDGRKVRLAEDGDCAFYEDGKFTVRSCKA